MIFINSPLVLLDKAFKNLYPQKEYKAYIDEDMKDEEGNKVFGVTIFEDGSCPIILVDSELTIKDSVEIFAHELSHVAVGKDAEHGQEWEEAFENIFQEYNRLGKELSSEW